MAQRKIPAINAGNIICIDSLKIVSAAAGLSITSFMFFKYTVPKEPTISVAIKAITTQTVAILLESLISFVERIPIKRTKMCGIPK